MKTKAGQHPKIRQSSHPYILAVYLEPVLCGAEEVVRAWFGDPSVTVDRETFEVVDTRIDRSGIAYFGTRVLHKTVSATLAFKAGYSQEAKRRFLKSWFVQNPYADIPIDPTLFDCVPITSSKKKTKRT